MLPCSDGEIKLYILFNLVVMCVYVHTCESAVYPRGYKGIYSSKLPKMDLTTDAEYVANLVNVIMWL